MNIMDRFVNADEYNKKIYDEKKMTQKDACLDYLERYGSITPLEALTAFNCFRLAAVIFKLRKDGYAIAMEMNKNGKPFGIYSLVREGEECDG